MEQIPETMTAPALFMQLIAPDQAPTQTEWDALRRRIENYARPAAHGIGWVLFVPMSLDVTPGDWAERLKRDCVGTIGARRVTFRPAKLVVTMVDSETAP